MLGSANIQNFPDHPPRQVAQDASTVALHCTLAGLQEIQPHEDTSVIRDAMDGWWIAGAGHETPIVGKASRWELLEHNVLPFHRPKLPRPENPHGAVTSVIVKSVERRHLPRFAVVNVHLVSGGYNGPKLPQVADRWRVEWGMYQDECVRLWKQGLTVFAVGDLNNPRPPQLRPHEHFTWLSPSGGTPDHLGQLTHQDSVVIVTPVHQRVPLNSDHDLHVITGPLRHADA